MQSGMKIALAIGLFVALVVTAYFVLSNRGGGASASANKVVANKTEPKDKARNQIEKPPAALKSPSPSAAPVAAKIQEPSPAIAQAPGKVNDPRDVIEIKVDPPSAKELAKPAADPARENLTPGGTEEPAKAHPEKLAAASPAKAAPEPGKSDVAPKLAAVGPKADEIIVDVRPKTGVEPAKTAATTGPTKEEEYTVQPGDNGFWQIAQKKYGDGKYMDVIAKANLGVDPLRLRVGQKIIIPPLPKEAAPAPGGAVERGTTGTNAAGQTVYSVKPGDSFWTIAEKHYGNGKYFYLIKEGNPKVDSNVLKIGQPLILPPKPVAVAGTTTRPTTASAGRTEPEPALKLGEEIYVVQPGENGFWGVALKKYGDGVLMGAIAKANPTVEPTRLRVGQRLICPPIEEARKMMGWTTTAPVSVTHPARERVHETAREPARERTRISDDGKPRFD